jgi:hypothetical protein
MLGSQDMIDAAKNDGNEWAYYGVATHFNDKAGCGRCYQISYLPYCGAYWASTGNTGMLCCQSGEDGDDSCNYSSPYNCFSSQLGHCCVEGSCDNCLNWSGPNSKILKDKNPSQQACEDVGGTYCKGWCNVCSEPGICEKCTYYPTKPLIVQSFNTGIDCTPPKNDSGGQFDIYMGAGGLGANVGCASTSTDGTTYGGGFYGGALDLWPDIQDGNRNGGVDRYDMCEQITNVPGFRGNDSDWQNINWGKEMIQNCKMAMGNSATNPINPYHGNWAIRYKEIKCPENLIKVTGLQLANPDISYDGSILPNPNPDLVKGTDKDGNLSDGNPGFTSSMMDCCKPSCSVNDMTAVTQVNPNWKSIYMCDKNGNKINLDQKGLEAAYLYQYNDESGKVNNKVSCFDTVIDGKPAPGLCDPTDIPDYGNNCTSNSDCCSGVCSKAEYSSICCPMFQVPDGSGNCKYISD